MSRGFVKEDDAQTAPLIPPRAALPPGTPNYVTPTGLAQLREELVQLEAERTAAEARRDNDTDRTHQLSLHNGRLALLQQRLASAKLVELPSPPPADGSSSQPSPPALDPTVVIRSRPYLSALVLAAILGIPISAVAYGFLAVIDKAQNYLFADLPQTRPAARLVDRAPLFGGLRPMALAPAGAEPAGDAPAQ